MLANVFTRSLAERARATALYTLGMAAVSVMYLSVFPSMQEEMASYIEAVPEALLAFLGSGDLANAPGYIGSTVFGVFGPVLVVAAAATWGAAAIAGEEENHTLALLLAQPVPRLRVALHKLGAVVLALAVICSALFLVLVGLSAALDLGVGVTPILAGVVHLFALGVFAGSLAFALGSATGRRSVALGGTLGLVVAGYVLSGVTKMVDGLAPLAWVSPFHWYNGQEPLANGFSWLSLALLAGFALAFALAGLWRFDRRDLLT